MKFDKNEIIYYANQHSDFWKMIDYVDWYNLTDFGKNKDHNLYFNSASYRFNNYIKQKIRKNKLYNINNFNKIYIKTEKELINHYYSIYYRLYLYLVIYIQGNFKHIQGKYNTFDIINCIIGYGKDFFISVINNSGIILDIIIGKNYTEKFNDIFNKYQ